MFIYGASVVLERDGQGQDEAAHESGSRMKPSGTVSLTGLGHAAPCKLVSIALGSRRIVLWGFRLP